MTAAMRWTISLLGPRWLTAEEMSCKAAVAVAVEAVVAVAEAVVAVVEAVVVVVVAVAMESVEAAAIDGAVDVSTTELH